MLVLRFHVAIGARPRELNHPLLVVSFKETNSWGHSHIPYCALASACEAENYCLKCAVLFPQYSAAFSCLMSDTSTVRSELLLSERPQNPSPKVDPSLVFIWLMKRLHPSLLDTYASHQGLASFARGGHARIGLLDPWTTSSLGTAFVCGAGLRRRGKSRQKKVAGKALAAAHDEKWKDCAAVKPILTYTCNIYVYIYIYMYAFYYFCCTLRPPPPLFFVRI